MNHQHLLRIGIHLLTVAILFEEAAEGARPSWIVQHQKEDAQYRYYIGRSTPTTSQAEAFKQAYQDSVESAIKENFGYTLEIDKSSYQAMDKTAFSEKVREQFRQVEMHGFELQEQYFSEAKDSTFEAYTLFRYSKLEIKKEQDRLSNLKENKAPELMSELRAYGKETDGILSLVTKPASAWIYIDGESYGKSNARIRN